MTRTDTLDVASAAARAAGHGAKEAARIGRLVAVMCICLRDAPHGDPMHRQQLAAEMRHRGIDPLARLVLQRALTVALDAGIVERCADGRLTLPWEF